MLQAPSWEDKHGQSAVLQMAAEGLETAQATGWDGDGMTWEKTRIAYQLSNTIHYYPLNINKLGCTSKWEMWLRDAKRS